MPRKKEVQPIKYDSKGRPLYPPKIWRKWQKDMKARTREYYSRNDFNNYRPDEVQFIPKDCLTSAEWLLMNGKAKYYMNRLNDIEFRGKAALNAVLGLANCWQAMSDAMREDAANVMVKALLRIIEDEESTPKDVSSAIGAMRGLMKDAAEFLKGKTGALPPAPTMNLTQVNFAAELEKHPELVKVLVGAAKRKGLLDGGEVDDSSITPA